MKNSRLFEVIKTFSKKEIRDFRKWLNSPFHNNRNDIIVLFEYLIKNKENALDDYLKKEIIFKTLFPEENFKDAKLRQVMFFLFKVLEEYIEYQMFESDSVSKKIYLAKYYQSKKLEKSLERAFDIIQKEQDTSLIKDEYYFHNDFFFQNAKSTFLLKSNRKRAEINLQELSDALDKSFIVSKLRLFWTMIAHQNMIKINYNYTFIENIIKLIEEKQLLDTPTIAVYYYGYKILINENSLESFEQFKNYISNSHHIFPIAERKDIYVTAINYCIQQLNKGKTEFIKEAFELYKEALLNDALIEDNNLDHILYINIVSLGLKLKEFSWIEHFIKEYSQYLSETKRESYYNFSLSRLHYSKGNFNKAMELLSRYEHKDMLINLTAKTMLLKIYYEISEMRALESLLESMRAYLQRKKVIGYHKEVYKNLIRYTKKLLKVNPYSRAQKEKLKAEIEAAKPLTEKAWLLKQLAEL